MLADLCWSPPRVAKSDPAQRFPEPIALLVERGGAPSGFAVRWQPTAMLVGRRYCARAAMTVKVRQPVRAQARRPDAFA